MYFCPVTRLLPFSVVLYEINILTMKKFISISLLVLSFYSVYAQKVNIELTGGFPTMKYSFEGDYDIWNDSWFFDAAHPQIGLEYEQGRHLIEFTYAFLQDYRPHLLNGKNRFMQSAWEGDHQELSLSYKIKVLNQPKWYLSPVIGCTFQLRRDYNRRYLMWSTETGKGYDEPRIEPMNIKLYELNRRSGFLLRTGLEFAYHIHKRWSLMLNVNYFKGFKTLLKYEAEYYKIAEKPNAKIKKAVFWSDGSYASLLIGIKYTLMQWQKD